MSVCVWVFNWNGVHRPSTEKDYFTTQCNKQFSQVSFIRKQQAVMVPLWCYHRIVTLFTNLSLGFHRGKWARPPGWFHLSKEAFFSEIHFTIRFPVSTIKAWSPTALQAQYEQHSCWREVMSYPWERLKQFYTSDYFFSHPQKDTCWIKVPNINLLILQKTPAL